MGELATPAIRDLAEHMSDGLVVLREKADRGDGPAKRQLAKLAAIDAAEVEARENACPTCGWRTPGWVGTGVTDPDDPDHGKIVPCPTCQEPVPFVDQLRRRLPKRLRAADSMDDRKPPDATPAELDAKDVAMRAVMAWGSRTTPQLPWLVLVGDVGVGKTTAGVRALLERAKADLDPQLGVYVRVPDLLGGVRDSIDDHLVEEMIERYSTVPLLMVDDIGVEKRTEWTNEVLYRVLDRRYSEEMDTILASNVEADELERRLADRMVDANVVTLVEFTWASYRSGERGG